MRRTKTTEMIYCGLFTALIAVGAFIKIPVPVVPFTLQFLFTTLAGLLLGSKPGAASTACYVLLGLVGLPIFTEGGGLWYIFKPSFGYLIGFIAGAYITGRIAESGERTIRRLLAANFSGLVVVYAFGMIYCYLISNFVIHSPISAGAVFLYCFVLAVPGDICICIVSAFLARRVESALHISERSPSV